MDDANESERVDRLSKFTLILFDFESERRISQNSRSIVDFLSLENLMKTFFRTDKKLDGVEQSSNSNKKNLDQQSEYSRKENGTNGKRENICLIEWKLLRDFSSFQPKEEIYCDVLHFRLDSEITKVTEQLLQAIANSDFDTYKCVKIASRFDCLEKQNFFYSERCAIRKSLVLNLKQLEI